jgi:hypothetical protein
MESAYHPEKWNEFYLMVGGSLAALTGLLFVATSLHLAEISKTPHFRVRAFGNTFELVGQFINSALVLTPQPLMWLGIELAVFNVFLFLICQVRFQIVWAKAGGRVEPLRSIPGAIGGVLCILGGVSIAIEFGGGLYLSALGTIILTWVVIWNAFSMMVAQYDDPPQSN